MIKPPEVEAMARAAGDPKFREWLAREKQTQIDKLGMVVDSTQLYRAQGAYQLLVKMENLLAAARNLP